MHQNFYFGSQTRFSKKQTCFRFLQQVALFASRFRFLGWWRTAGHGHLPLESLCSKRYTKPGEGRKRGRRRTRSQREILHMVRACRGGRSSLGTLSVSALSPCDVMSTDILLPAMMIPGGILLVVTLCIIMSLHQLALTVFLPRRPCPSSSSWHRRILRRLLQSLRHLTSRSTSVHSGNKSRGTTLPSTRNKRRKKPTLLTTSFHIPPAREPRRSARWRKCAKSTREGRNCCVTPLTMRTKSGRRSSSASTVAPSQRKT